MKNLMMLPLVAMIVALASNLSAISPVAGEDAPSLGSCNWVVNEPAEDNISELKGEVVLVEAWGINCPPCVRFIPTLNEKHEKYGKKGLHIFTFHRQSATDEKLKDFAAEKGIVYPVASSGGGSYNTGGGIPKAWVIGVDGKIKFAGSPYNASQTIQDELAKVKYIGLGMAEVHEDLEDAAEAYVEGDLESAREEANEVKADSEDEAALADADTILQKIEDSYNNMLSAAEDAEGDRNYLKAQRMYEQIEEAFGRAKEAEEAEAKLDTFKDDKAIRDEIKSAESLEKDMEKAEGSELEDIKKDLERFIDSSKNEGTWAAELAKEAMDEDDPVTFILNKLRY